MNLQNSEIQNLKQLKLELLKKLAEVKKDSLENTVDEIIETFCKINDTCMSELKYNGAIIYFDETQKKYKTTK